MFLRLFGILLVLSAVWGCESLSTNHRTSDSSNNAAEPQLTLTSLSTPRIPEPSDLTDNIVIPEETRTGASKTQVTAEPFPTIYFPFDSWEITPEVQERLDATAAWMIHFSRYELTIEGHADVRGSESYNMVLGVRRAKAVKDYLAQLGIPRTRLDIVSYGDTLVLCDVDDEKHCHQYNRRADLLLE